MKYRFFLYLIIFLFTSCSSKEHQKVFFKVDPEYGKFTEGATLHGSQVILVPQWHLASNKNTDLSEKKLPQFKNQQAIYLQISQWVDQGLKPIVMVEGCEGEIKNNFSKKFNGWDLASLSTLPINKLHEVNTQVGIKLKARYKNQIDIVCGDNEALIKKHQLVLSDIRGLMGFYGRIRQYSDKSVRKVKYIKGLKKVLQLPLSTSEADTMKTLKIKMKQLVQNFSQLIRERNDFFVDKLAQFEQVTVVVLGALHIKDLKQKIAPLRTVQIFEPRGLPEHGEGLVKSLKKAIDQI